MGQIAHVTIATSSGLLRAALLFHFGTGLIALVAGSVAVVVGKGTRIHRSSGLVFVCSMIATGITASAIAVYENNVGSTVAGALLVYFVFTAWSTMWESAGKHRAMDMTLTLFISIAALLTLRDAFGAIGQPRGTIPPVGMRFFIATIVLLAAIGDIRMIRVGSYTGARRLARHLWRMCFGLFIASGSFFLGQMKFLPQPLRILPVLLVLAVAPLIVLLYWMWRVRVRQSLRGMTLRMRAERV
jgi:uncharacterized membrane protein